MSGSNEHMFLSVNWNFTHNLVNQPACIQVGDLLYPGVGVWQLHLKLSCINLKNDPRNGLLEHFMRHFFLVNTSGTNNTAMCVHYSSRQLGACGCWWIFDERMDPLPGQVEYSVHTQSHTWAHTDTHAQTHTKAYTCVRTHGVVRFLCCSTVLRQAGASEGDIRVCRITADEKHTRKWCLLFSMVSILEIIGAHAHAQMQGHPPLFTSSFQVAREEY